MPLAAYKDLCIDASDPERLATFWGELLGRRVERLDDGDAALRGATPTETVWVNRVPEPKTVKHRVHIDVTAVSLAPIEALGATVTLAAAESGFPWTVMADPEGTRSSRRRGSTNWWWTPLTVRHRGRWPAGGPTCSAGGALTTGVGSGGSRMRRGCRSIRWT
jgi:hypothetical protein